MKNPFEESMHSARIVVEIWNKTFNYLEQLIFLVLGINVFLFWQLEKQ